MLNEVKSASGGSKTKTCTLSVSGTHCHSCELIIESEIKKLPGIKSVTASTKDQQVTIEYKNKAPEIASLNKLFKDNNYVFSSLPITDYQLPKSDPYLVLLISSGIIILFILLQQSGLFSLVNVNATSATPLFLLFGLLAGFSTCAALVGGIVLTFARQGIKSVIYFNLGRLVLFTIFGALLGYFGSFFRLSIVASAVITIIVSLIMIVTALQFLNLKFLNFINFALPKSFTGKIVSSQQSSFIIGGLTFFLPCGFTLTAQSLALGSSSWLTGGLIMMFFALGTLIPLIIIGFTGAKSQSNPVTAKYFSQIAGILILAFAIFNLSSQYTVLGFSSPSTINDLQSKSSTVSVVNGKQLIEMVATSTGYTPDTFTIKAGQPVRWETTDKGTSGCTNAVIARSLFDGAINLVPGTTSVKEFIAPTTPGRYRFSCWMGMISGTIEVVE